MRFHTLNFSSVDWNALDGFEDRMVFQTREWLQFVAATQEASPLVAELRDGSTVLGYFSGLIIRRFGLRILGSSFPGWTTPYIGFNLRAGIPRWRALEALEKLAFGELNCVHMEVSDRFFTQEDGSKLGFLTGSFDTYETDLTVSEEELFKGMSRSCRWSVRKAAKNGVRIEETCDEVFARDYYHQLREVFAKQALVPTYDLQRVEQLIRHLLPTGRLLLLRAMNAQGDCIATGIFPGMNKVAEFWGGASYTAAQRLRPNEALLWHAMQYWKRRGVEVFDWGGLSDYKEKYGVKRASIPWFQKSRLPLLGWLREKAKGLFWTKQRLIGRLTSANPV